MKIDTLEPDFKPMVQDLLNKVNTATGRTWEISDARRTMAQQATIYAQGRTAPGKVVSNAPPGSSAHNFGLAVDIWPMKDDDFDWNAPDDLFHIMADIAVSLGLTAGYYFHTILDKPHIEHPRWKEKQALWKEGKITVA